MDWLSQSLPGWIASLTTWLLDALWIGGLAAIPVVLLVAIVTRVPTMRPATRHTLWLAAAASFVTPMIGLAIWRPDLPSLWPAGLVEGLSEAGSTEVAQKPDAKEGSISHAASPVTPSPKSAIRTQPVWPEIQATPNPTPNAFARSNGRDQPVIETMLASQPAHTEFRPVSELLRERTLQRELNRREPSTHHAASPKSAPAPATSPTIEPTKSSIASPSEPSALAQLVALGKARALTAWNSTTARAAALWRGARDGTLWTARAVSGRPWLIASVWIVGVLAFVVARVAAMISMRRRLVRMGQPGDAATLALVNQVSQELGLRKPPEVVIADASHSPMIWCGRRPRLVLPRDLWAGLSLPERRAVVLHELAHVRRCDPAVCWASWGVGAAFWWHPFMWWTRKGLHDAAEQCCDAWVTRVYPAGRKAYATALVATNSFLSDQSFTTRQTAFAGPGLGIHSGPAKRLARRITMVMTERKAPGLSVLGVALSIGVLVAGMFVTPSLACPPEEKTKNKEVKGVKIVAPAISGKRHAATGLTGVTVHAAPRASAVSPRVAVAVPCPPEEVTTTINPVAPAAIAEGQAFLGEAPALEAMRGGAAVGQATAPRAFTTREGIAIAVPGSVAARAPRVAQGFGISGSVATPAAPGETIARSYYVSDGKLDALYELMARQDVPIFVSQGSDHIEVNATQAQHEVFGAFIRMIDPENAARNSRGASGGGGAGGAHAGHAAGLAQHEALAALTDRAKADQSNRVRVLRDQARLLERSRAEVERQAERTRREGDRVREQAERMRERANELRERASAAKSDPARAALNDAHSQLETSEATLRGQMATLEQKMADLEQALARLEEQAESIEDQADELESDDGNAVDEIEVEGIEIEMPAMPEPPEAAEAPEAPEAPEAVSALLGVPVLNDMPVISYVINRPLSAIQVSPLVRVPYLANLFTPRAEAGQCQAKSEACSAASASCESKCEKSCESTCKSECR